MSGARIILAAFCLGLAPVAWLALARARPAWRLTLAAACLLAGLAGLRLPADTGPAAAASEAAAVTDFEPTPAPFIGHGRKASLGPLAPVRLVPEAVRAPTPTPLPAARLIIPDLELEAVILPVPIRDGAWDVTGLGKQVGWLETTGARPGDTPAMTLAGHATVTAVEQGAFARLWKLRLEAEVIYAAPEGEYHYQVYDKRELQPDEVRPLYLDDGQVLQLITCAVWDAQARDYTRRLLVRARLVSAPAAGRPAPLGP